MNDDDYRMQTSEQIQRRLDEHDALLERHRQVEANIAEQRRLETEYRERNLDEAEYTEQALWERLSWLERMAQRLLRTLTRVNRTGR